MEAQNVPEAGRSVGPPNAPLILYASVQTVLVVAALVIPYPVGGICNMVAMLSGLVILTVRTVRVRPRPGWAWGLVVASGWILVLGAVVASVAYGLEGGVNVRDAVPILISTVPFPVLAAGLGLFSWVAPRRGPVDVLDSLMVALAAFLLLWTVWLGPAFAANLPSATIATALPLGLVLVVTMGVKLTLGGGAKDRPVALVLLGAAALSGAMITLLVPGLGRANLQVGLVTNLLWALFGVALGAAALHPDLDRPREGRGEPVDDTSVLRTVLFAGLALVPLAVWAHELSRQPTPGAQAVPIAVSAVLLIVLVVRMAVVARLAHQRATQLDRRSTALASAVSRQQELQQQLSFRAAHDPLTSLSNRTVLAERMEHAFANDDGPGSHALLLFDLDRFKDVNDTYGHPIGDELLIAVADRLRGGVAEDAVLARLGGDEFALFLEQTTEREAVERAESLLDALRPTYLVDGHEFAITASVGVLATDAAGSPATPAEALIDADLALYRAKELGKDRIETFRPELRLGRIDHARMTTELRRAAAADELVLHYQPVVNLASGSIIAVEALLRWRRPDGQLMAPESFLPVAEDSGLICSIGAWVLRQACLDASRWHADRGVAVFVNISGRQLDDPSLARTVMTTMADAELPSEALVLEITEGSVLTTSSTDLRYRQLRALRDQRIRLAIDDFGTGYSSLSYVAQLPIDIVKIDKSLIRVVNGGPEAARSSAFTRAVVELVNSMELTAVAEGVETADQARALRATNCPLAQGFHFYRPMPADELDAVLGLDTPVRPGGARPGLGY